MPISFKRNRPADAVREVHAESDAAPGCRFIPALEHKRVGTKTVDVQLGLHELRIIERRVVGFDDPVYSASREVWERVPRGQAEIQVRGSDGEFSSVGVLVGCRKFGYRDSTYGHPDRVVTAVGLEKENGECAHVAAFSHRGEAFWVCGSKHVSIVVRAENLAQDLRVWNGLEEDHGRYYYATKIATLWVRQLRRTMNEEQRGVFHRTLAEQRWTASAEAIFGDSQHLVLYDGVCDPEAAGRRDHLRFFSLSDGAPSTAHVAVPLDTSADLFERCGLQHVRRSARMAIDGPEYKAFVADVARRANSEGVVVYGEDSAGAVCCMWKEKAFPYVMERVAREAICRGLAGKALEHHLRRRLAEQDAAVRRYFDDWEQERVPFLLSFAAFVGVAKARRRLQDPKRFWLTLQQEWGAMAAPERAAVLAEAEHLKPECTAHVVMLVGPPGSGKSTLCRALCTALQKAGATPAWVNQDEAGGNRQRYLQAVEAAVGDRGVTHILLDKANLDERNRQDYLDAGAVPTTTLVLHHPDGPEALEALCVDRVLRRGASHRSLRAEATHEAARHVAGVVKSFVQSAALPDAEGASFVDASLAPEPLLLQAWAALQRTAHAPLPELQSPGECLAVAREYEELLSSLHSGRQAFAALVVPLEQVAPLLPAAALEGKVAKSELHVTLKFFGGRIDPAWFVRHGRRLGQTVALEATAVAFDDRAAALVVRLPEDVPCANATPHITVALAQGTFGVHSNAMLQSPGSTVIPLPSSVRLDAVFAFQ